MFIEPNFVVEKTQTLQTTNADFVSPIICDISTINGHFPLLIKIKDWLFGVSYRKSLKGNCVTIINNSGGFTVNTNIQPYIQYFNQSGHGICLFSKTKKLKTYTLKMKFGLKIQNTLYQKIWSYFISYSYMEIKLL